VTRPCHKRREQRRVRSRPGSLGRDGERAAASSADSQRRAGERLPPNSVRPRRFDPTPWPHVHVRETAASPKAPAFIWSDPAPRCRSRLSPVR
jgi:hypothetical protein